MQRMTIRLAQGPSRFSQFANGVAKLICRRVRRQRRAERDRHGIGYTFGQLPEETATVKAEDAAPHAVKVNGNNRRRTALHDPFESPTERQQCPRPRDLSLRKDADELTPLECGTGIAQGTQDDA